LVTVETLRGPADEQGNVAGDRKLRPRTYWYGKRVSYRESRIQFIRERVRERLFPMEKERVASGQAVPAERPGRKLPLSPSEQSARDAKRERKKNLLQKRESYEEYFSQALKDADQALLRVRVKRLARDRLFGAHGPFSPQQLTRKVWADHTRRAQQFGEKEIKKTKKYLTKVLDRLERELKKEKKEKNLARYRRVSW